MDIQPGKEMAYAAQLVKERSPGSSKVKLCGYLKKKRNKVGGWRKMWFVLQDKLLLSYASKEEYDTKLVSFKDVLNLVPGTLVRPLGGFRFTIETTTQAMYTFHCEDRCAYREWITMLLESLTAQSSAAAAMAAAHKLAPHPLFCNTSMDNIPLALNCGSCESGNGVASFACSHAASFDSISQVERTAAATAASAPCVRLPIARSTAKILERNGVNSSDLEALCQQRKAALSCSAHHWQQEFSFSEPLFRQQQTAAHVHQLQHHNNNYSYSYCKSNSNNNNWSRRSSALELPSAFLNVRSQSALSRSSQFVDRGRQHTSTSRKQTHCQNCGINDAAKTNLQATQNSKAAFDCENLSGAQSPCRTEIASCARERRALSMVKERIQRLSIRGSKEVTLDELSANAVAQQQRSKVTTTNSVEQQVSTREELPIKAVPSNGPVPLEPVYAVVDLKHKYAQRRMRSSKLELKRCNSYDSIVQSPIDASKLQRSEKSASLSDDDIEGIYEDGEAFAASVSDSRRHSSVEEENIYEPINVPAAATVAATPNAFWKYFTRLKVNSLRQLTRMRSKRSPDYDTIKMPKTSHKLAAPSHFSTIKHKFGTHRKSMQVRVRKLCARAYEPPPFFKQPSAAHEQQANAASNISGSGKKTTYRWRSVKLRRKTAASYSEDGKARLPLFGSLQHARKTRISLFVSQHFQLGAGEQICKSDAAADQQLKHK